MCAPILSDFKQFGGTLNAVWLVLTAVGAWEGCVSTAVVRNPTGNTSLTSIKAVEGMEGKQAPDSRALVNTAEYKPASLPRETWI